MTENNSPRLAVLIDADNASSRIVDGLFEEIAKIGEASVRRIYGDFTSTRLKTWTEVLANTQSCPIKILLGLLAKTHPISPWLSTLWTYCSAGGSTDFA